MFTLDIPIKGTIIPFMGIDVLTPVAVAPRRRSGPGASALADALFTATQQRVLALLFGQPDREFFVTEIIELAGSGRGAVQRELARLAASGLAVVSRAGNRKLYRANRGSPLFDELCSIVRKTIGLEQSICDALQPLADRLILAALFGSVARGTDTATSDIDLLLVSDNLTLEAVYAAVAPTEGLLGRRVNPMLYTSTEFERRRAAKAGFLTRILQGPHSVLMGSLDAE